AVGVGGAGRRVICDKGDMVCEAERFSLDEQLLYADIDLDRIVSDRGAINSFGDSTHDPRERVRACRTVPFELGAVAERVPLRRDIERFPYVPSHPVTR